MSDDQENTNQDEALEPVTVQLKKPFEWAEGETITEITVPVPMTSHLRGLNFKRLSTESDEIFKLIQKLLGQPPKYLDRIAFPDMQKIIKVVEGFLDDSPTTGNTSSSV